jgi:two-component system, NarL family, nitrate/nitrite sensor histidine kinase NarX
MSRPWNLTAKLGAIGGTLLLLALASIGLTLWVTWQLDGGAAAVNEAGRLRMQTWRLAQTLAAGDDARLRAQIEQFNQGIVLLKAGDPSRPLFVPHDAASNAAFAEVQQHWQILNQQWLSGAPPEPGAVARQADEFVGRIDRFVSAIESQLARWTSMLNLVQFAMMGLAIAAAVALLYAAVLFVFNPLSRLQRGLARVEGGDLAAHVEVASQDEFGALSAGFNRMAQTLQGLYQNLEAKVAEKTEKLQAKQERLAALYEVSAFVARAGSLDELARGFVPQVRRVARADAAVLRWSDEANQRYVLIGSDCLPQAMVEAEHCVPTGSCLCGQPQAEAATRVIPLRTEAQLGHCIRAGFDSVVSVPVRLHERLLGEIDLFYRSAPVLTEDDRSLLDALAAHVAGAMEGLRAGALEREAAVADERSLLARELHDSIAQSLAFLKIQVQLLRDAVRRGDAVAMERVIGELDAGVKESTGDVRELLVHFRTRTNAEDIAPALQTTLRKFQHQTGLLTHLHIEGHGLPLAPDVQVQVLHVVQEALSNVRKHARAGQVWVDVQQAPGWRVEVRDDGRGFAEDTRAGDETHVGLRIMRERASAIGAEVEVASVPGAGTCVVLTLPTPAQAQPMAA